MGLADFKRILRSGKGSVPDSGRKRLKPGPKRQGPRGRKPRLAFKKPSDKWPQPPSRTPERGPAAALFAHKQRFAAFRGNFARPVVPDSQFRPPPPPIPSFAE